MMDFASVIYGAGCTIVGAILGATASWFFSRKYYLKSKDDADKAMIRLLHDHTTQYRCFTVLARMLEESGIGTPNYDATGNLTGVKVSAIAHAVGSSTVTATGKAVKTEPPRYDRQHEQPYTDKSDGSDA